MRIARITFGLLLALAGLVATAVGAVAAFWLVGPDNTISTPARGLTSSGVAVVTAPALLDRHGPTLHVTATGDKPLFVGVGQDLDVSDYLSGAANTRLIRFDPPRTFGTQEMRGRTNKLTPPGELDWWVAQSAPGTQSISWPIQDGKYDVVVMNADGTPAVNAQVSFGIQVHRLFGICLLILGAGILVLAVGLTLILRRRPAKQLSTASSRGAELTPEAPVRTPATDAPAPAMQPAAEFDYSISPFAPERVSPFAPVDTKAEPKRTSVPAEQMQPTAAAPLTATPAAATTARAAAARAGTASASVGTGSTGAGTGSAGARAGAGSAGAGAGSTGAGAGSTGAGAGSAGAGAGSAGAGARSAGAGTGGGGVNGATRSQSGVARPTPVALPAAPVFMSAAAVARAKAPVLIGGPVDGAGPAWSRRGEPEMRIEKVDEDEVVPLAASPEFEKSDEAVRRTAALLASGALLLTTTSCGLVPPKNSLTAPESRPAVTLADAQTIVQHYNEVNNKANQTRDAKLSATVEGYPTLAQTQAGFVIGRKLDAAGKDTSKPFTYTTPEIGAPQFSSYPMRFVVSSGISNAPGSRQLGVWQRENAGSPWLLTHSVYPSKTVALPTVDGLRTPEPADLSQLDQQPEAVAQDLATYLTAGPKAPQAKRFIAAPSLTSLLQQRSSSKLNDTAEPYIASVTDAFLPAGKPLSFITASGDALVFLTLTEQYLQRVEPGSNAFWTSGEATAFSNGAKYTQTLHQDYLHQVAVVIPSKANGGPVRVLSIDPQLIGAGGA
ncbi:hypothetical protein PWY87_19710 [Kribbella solani]|uniref:hypothetical protein n=1 Tax=Kribbella solani TaxID=236067 RepID=UPI0029A4CBE9|nr:hypothetical protein [Kribbella solani]MDX3003925.1 hypothetical protein [Kribbella solani]